VTDEGDLFVEKRAGKVANSRARSATSRPALALAWRIHAGRHTAAPATSMPIPTPTAVAASPSFTTASSENFRELRDELVARGHTLKSETDTEVIAHLVEDAYKETWPTPCVQRCDGSRRLRPRGHAPKRTRTARGCAAQRAADRRRRGRRELPGIDAAAIVTYTDKVIFLGDGDVADLLPGTVVITDRDGVVVERPIDIIPWTADRPKRAAMPTSCSRRSTSNRRRSSRRWPAGSG